MFRQFGLLVGFSLSIALGISIVFWARTPDYRLLYGNLMDKDSAQIADELQRLSIPYKLQGLSGNLMVPEKYIHDARLSLARVGLPKSGNPGIELLENSGPFGNSELMENARYQRALEGELAQSIQSISIVQSARVHLALPKQSAFIRSRQQTSASVLVNMYSGHSLKEEQVAAIRNMVAAGVANLSSENVTVIDQDGQLLTQNSGQSEYALNNRQFDHTQKLEEVYISRIENLLTPIIGQNGVRAQVVLDMDYSVTEQAQELYNPETMIVRSEQIQEDGKRSGNSSAPAAGVPGSLSNQDPYSETVAQGTSSVVQGGSNTGDTTKSSNLKITRNYEIDKTVSHTRVVPGKIRRLSAAVVVDDKQVLGDNGRIERAALTEDELDRMTTLIKEAVGFNAERGDSIHLSNTSFIPLPEPVPLPKPSLMEQPWIWDAGRITLSGIGILFLLFGVLRPVMRNLAVPAITENMLIEGPDGEMISYSEQKSITARRQTGDYENELNAAKAIVAQDPKRVAQVVKNWVASDA